MPGRATPTALLPGSAVRSERNVSYCHWRSKVHFTKLPPGSLICEPWESHLVWSPYKTAESNSGQCDRCHGPKAKCDNDRHSCRKCAGLGIQAASYPSDYTDCPHTEPPPQYIPTPLRSGAKAKRLFRRASLLGRMFQLLPA
jgi:hypothetical protein